MIRRILNKIRNRRIKKRAKIIAEANKFFNEFVTRQLAEMKLQEEIESNYYE